GVLVPALAKARQNAKRVATRVMMDAMGKGLRLFRNELPGECPKDGFPSSSTRAPDGEDAFRRASDDPTESGYQRLSGAQWLVRYLVGKDAKGYVPKENVPRALLDRNNTSAFWSQRGWYDETAGPDNMNLAPLPRAPLYADPDRLRLRTPRTLPGAP